MVAEVTDSAYENSSENNGGGGVGSAIGAIQSIKFNYEVATRTNGLARQNRRNYAGSRRETWSIIDFLRATRRFSVPDDPTSISSTFFSTCSPRRSITTSGRSTPRAKRSTRGQRANRCRLVVISSSRIPGYLTFA